MSVQINVQASQSALAQSIAQGVAAFNSRYAGQNQLNLQINARAFSQPLGRITSDLADFESALKASNARVLAFGASTAVLGGVVRSFKEIANVTIEVEKALTDINRVLNLSTSGLQKFSSELFNVSKQTASSFDDATKAALEFSRQGLNTEETLKRTADALTLVRLTGISSTKAVEDLTATINGFAKAGLTTSQVVNKLAAVEQDFAVSATDLTEALSRTGQAAQEAGVSFDELNALVTTAQQNTARGGAVIGNALKTIFTRLQRTETLDQLQNFNIAVRDIEGNILPAVQILKNFADRYNDLADAQRAQLSEQVAGVYQVNILKGVIKDLNNSQGTYVQALERGAMAANEADIANEKLNKTLSALVTQTGVGLQQLANNVGKVTFAPIFEAIVSPVNDAVSYINDTLEGEGIGSIFANGLLKGVRNVIAGPGLAVAFAVIAKVAKNTFEDATKALPAILGLTTEAQKRANIEKSIISILQTQSNLSLALQGQQGNLSSQAATVLNYARLQTAQYQQQLQIAQQLAPLLAAQNVTVGSRGIQVGPKIKAGGHIPAFAEMSERMGAAMGGYKSGKVVKAPKSVGANTYMNSAEEVKYISGFAQPFINPPANSKAGRKHRQNAINRTGVDPYMASGFIPNFAEKSIKSLGKESLNNLYDVGDRVDNQTYYDKYDDQGLIKMFKLPYTYDEYRLKAAYAFNNALKIYKTQGANGGLENANKYLKNVTGGYAQALEKKYFEEPDTTDAKKHLNKIAGGFAENDTAKIFSKHSKLINQIGPDFSKIIANRVSFVETKVRKNDVSDEVILEKFLRGYAKISPNSFKRNKEKDVISAKLGTVIHAVAQKSQGFIPNFAPPTSAIRVPWFKKFGNPAFDTIQPTLGISKASDTDTFRSSQFRSKAFEKAATDGDPNLFAPLYEDFIFKALQLVSQPKIKDQLIRGYVNQPGTDQKQSAFDAFLGDVGLEFKGFPKSNLTGSISKNLNDKYERYAKANPTGAAKIKESIIAFNEIGDKNQLPSDFGKNFSQLAGTSYSEMVKNNPDLVKGLSAETNMLLERYVKDPNFLRMNAARGFIPNFANPKIKINSGKDAVESFYSKGSEVKGKKLTGGVKAFPVPETTDLYSVGSSSVSIPGSGFGISLYDAVLAEVSKKGAWLTSDRFTVSDKARRIWDGYRKLRKGDVKNKKLPMKHWFLDPAFNNGSYEFPMNPQDLSKNKSTWPPENDPVWSLQYAYQFKKSQLENKMSSGFIPNFADFIETEIDAILQPISKSRTIQSKQLFGKTLDSDAIRYLNATSVERLNKFLSASGYLDGALGVDFPDHADKKFLFTKNKGFIPNFSQLMKGYAFNDGRIYNDVYHSDAWDSIEGPRTGAIKYANYNGKLVYQAKNISEKLKQAFISRGIPESAFSPVEDVDAALRSKNTKEIQDKLNQVGAVQLSEGIKAIYENGRYTTFIKDNKSLRILGGITPDELKMYGGVDRFLAYRERVHGVQKWQSFANGFIPNFAMGDKMRTRMMKDNLRVIVHDLKTGKEAYAQPGKKGKEYLYHKDAYNAELKTSGANINDYDFAELHNLVRGFIYPNGKIVWDYSEKQQEALKDPNIKAKILAKLLAVETRIPKSIESSKPLTDFQRTRALLNNSYSGFIPNFNFIKGRNSFQKNWLIETAKKRNLNLNDPNVFHQLATEFAKRYPNDQGMFGLSKGFIPNFAYKQSVMALEEGMSGNKAIFDTKPFPHIRNSSQPTFSSAISDHGGLKNALSDSMRNQEAAGLMSNGFVPNFADFDIRGTPLQRSASVGGGAVSYNKINKAVNDYVKSIDLLTTDNTQIAAGITKLLPQFQLNQQSFNEVRRAAIDYAKAQKQAAAQISQQQQPAQKTLSTRVLGESRGGKFDEAFGRLSNNIGFNLAAPLLGGVAESLISGGKDRSEMGYGQRLASTVASAALTGLSTGAAIGTAIPGIGTAAGAAIGALVGFTGAAMNAKTNLNDLSKSINDIIDKNKKDIDSAKTIGQLEKQIAGETDPFAIAVLRMKIQEAADNISNTEFAKKLLSTTQSVEEFNKVINEFTLSSGPLNQLGNLPSLIQSFAKKTKTRETSSGLDAFLNFSERNSIFFAKQFEKNKNKAVALAGTFFDPIGIAFTNIQDQIEKTSPQAAKDFGDILNNIFELKKSGQLENKLKNLVDTNALSKELADEFAKFINETDNEYFDQYLKNLSIRLPIIRNNVKKDAVAQSDRIADSESLKKMFAKINDEIQNALNEAALQLMNIEFKSNIGKLNIEKIGGIFDTAASAIGKNLESIAKSQFDALMVQIQLSREAQLADLNRTQFEETRSQEMNKYLAERQSRVSTFFEKNIAPGKESRDMASQALAKIGSDLTYDFKNLESLAYNMGVEVENARKDLIRNEEFQKKSFLTQRSNAKTLFDLEQSYAKDLRDLKKKTSEEDLKLEEIKYANLLREKQIIQSFDFTNQARQIQTQAEVSRMGMGMEVNPNFFAGASRFQQEDYKFRLDREKEDKRIATEIRNATEQQRIVDIQRQVMSANTDATNENTKAIREYTIAFLNQQLSKVESGLSESKNASEKIEKIVTKIPDEKAPLNRKKTFADPENYVEKSFRFFNQAPQNNLIPGTNIDRRAGVNNYNYQNSAPQTPASEDKSPSLFEKSLDRFINFLNSTYSPKSRVLSDGPIYSGGQSFIQSEDTNIPQYKGADFLNFLNEGDRYVNATQTSNAVTTAENREIEVQRELTAEKQKQVELENQRKNINQQLQSIIKERTSTVQSSVSRISPDLSRVSIAKDELERLSGQLKINETSLAKLEAERKTTKESSRQVQLDQQIFDLQEKINKGKLDQLNYTEQIATIEERIKANNEYLASRGKFSTGVAKAMGSIKDETEMFKETLGTTTVNAFRDGLVGAMDAALNKADDLESALMGVAAGFLREIQGVMLRNIANNIVGGIGSAFSFGQPAATNQKGGLIRAQSGMYISGGRTGDKNPALLEDGEYVLNRNAVKALGGPRAIDQLNFNAFPRFADGGDPGTMSASVSMGEPFERLSMYGREQSPEYQSYLEKLREAEAARERKRAERKALINSLITTAITTGVMMGLTSGVQGLKSKFGSKTPLNKVAGSKPNLAQRAQLKKAGVSIGPDGLPAMQTGGAIGFNQGGFLPYGSRLTDSIPAYLTGGEYVINSRAVRKYGVGGLNRINSGVARFQDGGMVGDSMSPSSNSSNTSNSNISINITVNANNGKVGDQESDSTGDNTESNSKELSNRIKAVVLDVITTEQRSGGLLDSTKKK